MSQRFSRFDLYQTLGVSWNAAPEEIRKAYRRRARETHPDVGGSEEEFKTVAAAFEVLGNPSQRAVYDAELRSRRARRTQQRHRAAEQNTANAPGGNHHTDDFFSQEALEKRIAEVWGPMAQKHPGWASFFTALDVAASIANRQRM